MLDQMQSLKALPKLSHMAPFSSVSGSLVLRPGDSIALRKSGGNRHSSDLSNENGPGAEEGRKQVWVDPAPAPDS